MAEQLIKPVFALASNVTSSLGMNTENHWQAILRKQSGISQYEDLHFSEKSFWASKIDPTKWQLIHAQTQNGVLLSPFEQMAVFSAKEALGNLEEPLDFKKTVFILSSTKGNIEWLYEKEDDRLLLSTSAALISKQLGIDHLPIIVSHACVSGVIATLYALRLLQSGKYENAIITGADRFTKFVLNGFQSFQAIAEAPCKPFDKNRAGINLGEAAATLILSSNKTHHPLAQLVSGATSNDANHISGPSRTGEELAMAINKTIREARISAHEIDLVSAHGTATLYNDEMESKAFTLAGVASASIHSLKGYIGHTLGAAGIAETALLIEALRNQQLIPSIGFEEPGVSCEINVTKNTSSKLLTYALKTASGFGGCNAATVWKACN